MKFINVTKVSEKSPKEQLLELFATDNEPFIVMMSNEWFKEFTKCEGVCRDHYELNPPGYYGYFIKESSSISSKCLMKIEVKFVEGSVFIVNSGKIGAKRPPAEKIYYFQHISSKI